MVETDESQAALLENIIINIIYILILYRSEVELLAVEIEEKDLGTIK